MCGSEFYKDLPGSNNFIFKGTFYGILVALSQTGCSTFCSKALLLLLLKDYSHKN